MYMLIGMLIGGITLFLGIIGTAIFFCGAL